MQKSENSNTLKIIEKMRADRAQLLSYLSLKKVERLIHFYQNTENTNSIKTEKMNIPCNVLLCFRCGKDAHGSCASLGYWVMGHNFEF